MWIELHLFENETHILNGGCEIYFYKFSLYYKLVYICGEIFLYNIIYKFYDTGMGRLSSRVKLVERNREILE